MPKPIVAMVGRPNVGKSTLFNRMAEERLAVIDEIPGTTRDRLMTDATWSVVLFSIIVQGLTVAPVVRRLVGREETLSTGSTARPGNSAA